MVVDLSDVGLLHLPTLTWLPAAGLPCNAAQRGGTNALVRAPLGRCFIFGGMNSDAGNTNTLTRTRTRTLTRTRTQTRTRTRTLTLTLTR